MMPVRNTARRTRRAVTLLELLLALSLLVALSAIVWPALRGSFSNRRLHFAAEQLRSHLGQARLRAVQSGSIIVLRYRPQTAEYIIEPFQSEMLGGLGFEVAPMIIGQGGMGADVDQRDVASTLRKLPEGVTFLGNETLLDPREEIIRTELMQREQFMARGQELFEQQLFCYPDGTTSTAQLTIGTEEQRCMVLELRGLTGVVSLGEIMPTQELLR